MFIIILYIILFVQFQQDVQQLGVRSDMALSLLPVQLSVNIYMGNISYLRCPSFTYYIIYLLIFYIYVDSTVIITFILAPND